MTIFQKPKLCDSHNQASTLIIQINNTESCKIINTSIAMHIKNIDISDVLTYEKDIGKYLKVENIDDSLKFQHFTQYYF